MRKTAAFVMIRLMAVLFLSGAAALPACAGLQVLSVPGHPLSLVLDTKDGIIDSALLRSPAGMQKILPLEGLSLVKETLHQPHADEDLFKDLIWILDFSEPSARSKGVRLWISMLSGSARAWVDLCPTGRTYWDSMPVQLYIPEGVALYISPGLPQYEGLPRFSGSRTLSFVYTISLTPEGPRFVPSRDVYRQLIRITDLVRKGERLTYREEAYSRVLEDYSRLSRGVKPSTAAIQNFAWKRILTLQWR